MTVFSNKSKLHFNSYQTHFWNKDKLTYVKLFFSSKYRLNVISFIQGTQKFDILVFEIKDSNNNRIDCIDIFKAEKSLFLSFVLSCCFVIVVVVVLLLLCCCVVVHVHGVWDKAYIQINWRI